MLNRLFITFSIFVGLTTNPSNALATVQVGTLTQTEGSVQIFSNPSKTLQKDAPGPHALFEGKYYFVKKAEVGDKIEKDNILRTAPQAKARVVFENGDQINVGPGSAYRIAWNDDTAKTETRINLMYGKIRGIMEKGGPRGNLKIRTRSAVMGVRGTDFFIADSGKDGSTEVSIIRGSVEVIPLPAANPNDESHMDSKEPAPGVKPIQIKAGFSAEIPRSEPVQADSRIPAGEKMSPSVELRKTTQEEFIGIQKSSTIAKSSETAPQDQEIQKKIEKLEKKASQTALNDIKTYDKKLYAVLEKQAGKEINIDVVNQAALQNLMKDAPKAPEKRKPYKSELEDLDNGTYENYFKHVD